MSIEFHCPHCTRLLRTGDEKAGQSARCPQCGSAVTIPVPDNPVGDAAAVASVAPVANAIAHSETAGDVVPASDASRISSKTLDVRCPMCGATNEASAPRCLACGEELWAATEAIRGDETSRRFSSVWKEAWQRWKANIGISAAAAAIAGGLLTSVYILMIFGMMIFGAIAYAAGPGGGDDTMIFVVLFTIGLFYFVLFSVYAGLLAGLSKLALQITRQWEVGLDAMVSSVGLVARSIGGTLLILIALVAAMLPGVFLAGYGLELSDSGEEIGIPLAILGYAATFMGWGLAWGLFWPVHYCLIDGPPGFLSPMWHGVRMAVANPLLSLQLALTHLGLLIAGFLTCYVAMLFTVPFSFVLFAVAYNRCRLAMATANGADTGRV